MEFDPNALVALERDPHTPLLRRWNDTSYTARIAIPNYSARIKGHYGRPPSALPFRHFGLFIEFETPTELAVHDEARHLDPGLRNLLNQFGPLTFQNAYLPNGARTSDQRNIFESLRFHIDRGHTQEDNISLFWRDPFDPVQRAPRSSQTLVLANAAAYLQALKEGRGEHEFNQHYTLFRDEDIGPLIGEVMIELGWCAPEGKGEIAIIDNHRMLHASYYAHSSTRGYPISVRYMY